MKSIKYIAAIFIIMIFPSKNLYSQDYNTGGYQGGGLGSGGNSCLIHEITLDDTGGFVSGYGEGQHSGPPNPALGAWYDGDSNYTIWIHNPAYDTNDHFQANINIELKVSDTNDFSSKYNIVFSTNAYSHFNDTTQQAPFTPDYRMPPLDDIMNTYNLPGSFRQFRNYIDLPLTSKIQINDSVYSFCLSIAESQPEWIGVEVSGHNIHILNAALCIRNMSGPEPTMGRCCYADNGLVLCDDLLACDCDRLGGTWDPDVSCLSEACDNQAGACCLADGSCFFGDSLGCSQAGGSWQGPNTTCDDVVCPLPGNTIRGMCIYDNNQTTPLGGTTLYLYDNHSQLIDSTTSEPDGSFVFESVLAGDYLLSGASNTSRPTGVLNAADGLLILRHFVQLDPLSGIRKAAADVNNDGAINSTDALRTVEAFVDNGIVFPLGTWIFETKTLVSYDSTTTFVDVRGLFAGDVNASYSPVKQTMIDIHTGENEAIHIIPGEAFSYPVRLENAFDAGAISLVLEYNPDLFNIKDVSVPSGNGKLLFKISDNQLRLAWFGLDPMKLNRNDILLNIVMVAQSGVNDPTIPFTGIGWESRIANGDASKQYHGALQTPAVVTGEEELWMVSRPNPFRETTNIEFNLPSDGNTSLMILDLSGKIIYREEDNFSKGIHTIRLDASVIRPGIYIARLQFKTQSNTQNKVIRLIKL